MTARNFMVGYPALIAVIVVVDAFATSLFVGSIGFLIGDSPALDASTAMRVVGISALAGVFASVLLARLADRVSIVKTLRLIQALQVLGYVYLGFAHGLLGVGDFSVPGSSLPIALIFFLGRLVSPLRGALPPALMAKDELLGFKSKLRTATLSAVFLGALAVGVLVALPVNVSIALAVVGVAAYGMCSVFTVALPSTAGVPASGAVRTYDSVRSSGCSALPFFNVLSRREWGRWWLLLTTFGVVGIGPAMVPYVVSDAGAWAAWLLAFSSIAGIAVNASSGSLVRRYQFSLSGLPGRIVLVLATFLGMANVMLVGVAMQHTGDTLVFVAVMMLCLVANQIAFTASTVVAWGSQYDAGRDENRTEIVALFSMTGAVGGAAAQIAGGEAFAAVGQE
ncbi:hypothetical protein G7Y31_10745 [Corynebacterium lizhenjunii]|uniref:MFS transporter n=1 Tax=Corynebacterium lizhenjunii TaxID=2709394 RepID=A0A7T0KET0_9CORY|nr:hypothetical protein [Corynebacterium lizhenjunii]QPK78970.1 hypothetical protein G7Y31_10745 [Corynebacterium lizhenjunii]